MLNGGLARDEVGAQVRVLVAGEGVGGFAAEVEVDAADGEVHRREAPGRRVGFLTVDRHVAELAAVRLDELLGLHEHAAGAAAGVIDLAVVGGEDGDQGLDDRGRRVELAALLALGAGELAEEVFIDLPEHVAGLAGVGTEADGGHQINQFAELAVGQLGARIALVEDALEPGVLDFDEGERIVDALADVRLLGGGAQRFPACGLGHPEHIDLAVVVAIFEFFRDQLGRVEVVIVGRVGKAPRQFGTPRGEGVRDVLDEDQPEDQVLVFGGVHVGAQLVGGRPQGLLDVVEHGVASTVC
jgi:hypothetical protein